MIQLPLVPLRAVRHRQRARDNKTGPRGCGRGSCWGAKAGSRAGARIRATQNKQISPFNLPLKSNKKRRILSTAEREREIDLRSGRRPVSESRPKALNCSSCPTGTEPQDSGPIRRASSPSSSSCSSSFPLDEIIRRKMMTAKLVVVVSPVRQSGLESDLIQIYSLVTMIIIIISEISGLTDKGRRKGGGSELRIDTISY